MSPTDERHPGNRGQKVIKAREEPKSKAEKWIPIVLSVILASLNVVQYVLTTLPHTEFDEVKALLDNLNTQIRDAQQQVSSAQQAGENTTAWQQNLTAAVSLRDQANVDWASGSYAGAKSFIAQAYAKLANIPPESTFTRQITQGSSLVLLTLALLAIGVAVVAVVRARATSRELEEMRKAGPPPPS